MDFDEPGLEELIQSDLHSEMNKILDESDSENIITQSTTVSTAGLLASESNNGLVCSVGMHYPKCRSDGAQSDTSITPDKHAEYHALNLAQNGHHSTELFFQTNSIQNDVKQESRADFSGHFSVERFPTSVSDEHLMPESLVQKSEQSDLSNLAWLTTVDVQRELRSDSAYPISAGDNLDSAKSPHSLAAGGLLNPSIDARSLPPFQANQAPASHMPSHAQKHESRLQSRFTPIQPHPNPDGPHHRYSMHGAHHRTMMASNSRAGPHRYSNQHNYHPGYHPYPPPPYTSTSSNYNRDNYHRHAHNQKVYPKPVYSYSCLIAMSLQKSKNGCLPVADIYSFMMENFPYFKTAPDGWKNSVRHNLSLNKCFEKVEKPNGTQRKGCLWALNPAKVGKMEEEVQKWKRKDPEAIRRSMSHPDEFDREMEELRRADEEAARRRMLSLSSHGLSMATSPHGFPPGFVRQHSLSQGQAGRPHMHPSGASSLPTTPQHYTHQQASPYRHAWTPGNQMSGVNFHSSNGTHTHPPRQLFNFPPDGPGPFPLGTPELCSTPASKFPTAECSNLLTQVLSSPNSSSSTSSGATAIFRSLAGTLSASGHDFSDLDLDPNPADISTLQSTLWDDTPGVLPTQDGPVDASLAPNVFDESVAQRNGAQSTADASQSEFHVVGQNGSTGAVSDCSGVFPAHFRGNMSYLTSAGNNKAVMMH